MNIQSFRISDPKSGNHQVIFGWSQAIQFWLAHPTYQFWAVTTDGDFIQLNPHRSEYEDH